MHRWQKFTRQAEFSGFDEVGMGPRLGARWDRQLQEDIKVLEEAMAGFIKEQEFWKGCARKVQGSTTG